MKTHTITKQIDINAPVARVWEALTDHRQFGQWFGINLEGPFQPGKTTRGQITFKGYEHVVVDFMVEKMDSQRLLAYRWHPYCVDPEVDYSKETPTLVELELTPSERGTLLKVTESGFDKIPTHRYDEAMRMNTMGWEEQLENIANHVAPKV
ncbi:MAG: SRPBCC family protein [Verrucomicrobiota bacterium JB022]|nr:SRPBCC family protein [Verrucomicrobiota bacterium JB022]